jgi:hypothetical protein
MRRLLNEGGWEYSDLAAKRRFEEAIGEQEETLRIKWNKHVNGKMKPVPSSLEIRADFNDRLHAGDVPDLVGYE